MDKVNEKIIDMASDVYDKAPINVKLGIAGVSFLTLGVSCFSLLAYNIKHGIGMPVVETETKSQEV